MYDNGQIMFLLLLLEKIGNKKWLALRLCGVLVYDLFTSSWSKSKAVLVSARFWAVFLYDKKSKSYQNHFQMAQEVNRQQFIKMQHKNKMSHLYFSHILKKFNFQPTPIVSGLPVVKQCIWKHTTAYWSNTGQ